MTRLAVRFGLMSLVLSAAALPAAASTITWTRWSAGVAGDPGTATGTAGAVGVSYAGNLFGVSTGSGYPNFEPASSYSGGTVSNAPPDGYGIRLTGGSAYTETITFSQAVVNPIFAVWSLGQGSVPASFSFPVNEPITFEGGGAGADYGGQSITVSGNSILGQEGNGVVQVNGTYTSLSFTTPQNENYYAFTVGYTALAQSNVPEPISLALLGTGLVGAAVSRRMLRRKK